MAKTDSTKKKWVVQAREDRKSKWVTKWKFLRREDARLIGARMRDVHNVVWFLDGKELLTGYGLGNTRVIKHIRGEKK